MKPYKVHRVSANDNRRTE